MPENHGEAQKIGRELDESSGREWTGDSRREREEARFKRGTKKEEGSQKGEAGEPNMREQP